jgi:hypothetical protein
VRQILFSIIYQSNYIRCYPNVCNRMSDILSKDEVDEVVDKGQEGKKRAGNKIINPVRDINAEYQEETSKEKIME